MHKRTIVKKCLCLLLACMLCISLCGCWDYLGLDKLAIIAGVAIDKDEETEMYTVTFEIINTISPETENLMDSFTVKAEGKTFLDSVRTATQNLINKPYFGNLQTLVISHQIAEEDGIFNLLESFLRLAESRENVDIVISKGASAGEIITASEGEEHDIISYDIRKNLNADTRTTPATKNVAVYQALNELKRGTSSLTLPAFHIIEDAGAEKPQIGGLALFREDKLIGYLSAEETQYYLFLVNEMQRVHFAFTLNEDKTGRSLADTSLIVKSNTTDTAFAYEGGKFQFYVDLKTKVYLGENEYNLNVLDKGQMEEFKVKAQESLKKELISIVNKAQTELEADIFHFGTLVYQKNQNLWSNVKDDWRTYFCEAEVFVNADIEIINTGLIKNY